MERIGYRAFFDNRLASVVIAYGVTYIEDWAFSNLLQVIARFVIPPAMEAARMDALMYRVPAQYRGRIRAAYRLYDLDNLLPADDPAELVNRFPELEHTNIWVLQDRPAFLLEQIGGFLAAAGYTYGEWLADFARFSVAFGQNQIADVSIPGSVTRIGTGAFAGNWLTNVVIPGSVAEIGNRAFANNQLTAVTVPFATLAAADQRWGGSGWRDGIPANVAWIFAP